MVHIFILNPETGKEDFGENLRKELENMPITYYVFDTRFAGEEQQLIKRIMNLFEDEDIRVYCCGGSGTIRNVIDGIENLEKIEIAFYPNGMTNDFLKCFGKDAERFKNVGELIDGKAVAIDYIDTNIGPALNMVSLGVDARALQTINALRKWNTFFPQLPYNLGTLLSLIQSRADKYIVEIDGIELKDYISEFIYANGMFLAGKVMVTEQPKIQDGLAEYLIALSKSKIRLWTAMYKASSHQIQSAYKNLFHGKCKEIKIRREDGEPFYADFDGELMKIPEELVLSIKPRGLKFVIPKGVELP